MDQYKLLDRLNSALTFYGQLISTTNVNQDNIKTINGFIKILLEIENGIIENIAREAGEMTQKVKAELTGLIL